MEKKGPGAYVLPPILGTKRTISNLENAPAFSIGSAVRMSAEETYGTTKNSLGNKIITPGVGYYHPKFVLPKSPGFAPVSEERFLEPKDSKNQKLPISHVKDINITKPKKFGVFL